MAATATDATATAAPASASTASASTASAATSRSAGICVMTSGGDSQGMNACVRAVVRTALARGARAFVSMAGFSGLYKGTSTSIHEASWSDMSGILHRGGTAIATSRCDEFRTRAGRQVCALHLLQRGIDSLVVIGGDGSLTGASLFVQEWPQHCAELVTAGSVTAEVAAAHPHLYVAGTVGSIDNDMVGTDFTIGCVSALHRIVEAVDAICATAASHQRSFVVEVMGRACGWLALWAAVATGADFVFIPESPPVGDWRDAMCTKVAALRSDARPFSVVIVAEGAVDSAGAAIHAAEVKTVLETRLHHDTRVTILGHVQRGGRPAAFDRVMATLVGIRAVDELLAARAAATPEPFYVGASTSDTYVRPLVASVEASKAVGRAIAERRFADALHQRSPEVARMFATYRASLRAPLTVAAPASAVGVVHIGAPAPGMNAAVRAVTVLLAAQSVATIGISNGLDGLLQGHSRLLTPLDVNLWAMEAGAKLGSSRTTPNEAGLEKVAAALSGLGLTTLVVIGGFEAYTSLAQLSKAAAAGTLPAALAALRIVIVPSTISSNVPCTDYSVGFETALNAIVLANDACKLSADSTTRRVFVVEVMGARCGALAVLSAIASGAERAYIHEEGVSMADLTTDIARFHYRFAHAGFGSPSCLIIRGNGSSEQYTTHLLESIYTAESKGMYSVRTSILGYLQQGHDPSPMDRVRAMQLAAEAVDWVMRAPKGGFEAAAVGQQRATTRSFDFATEVLPEMDSPNRRPRSQWWLALQPYVPLMSLRPE